MRFEGRKVRANSVERKTDPEGNAAPNSPPDPPITLAEPGQSLRPRPVFIATGPSKSSGTEVPTINPMLMDPVVLVPGDKPLRVPDHERFDPLVLREAVSRDEAPMRAEGDHTFDPLAMKSKVFERAVEVNSRKFRLTSLLTPNSAKWAARRAFFESEAGRSVRSARRERARWIRWSCGTVAAISAGVAMGLYAALGHAGLEPRRLWLSISLSNLIAGTVLALIYPRSIEERPGEMQPRFLELMAGWVGWTMLFHFAIAAVLFPLLSGRGISLGFYDYSWPWLWISYGALLLAAALGWLATLLGRPRPETSG